MLASLFGITLICYANSLSLEFAATEAPGISYYGQNKIKAVCDPTRECALPTQSRSQCSRIGCCWQPTSNKCVSKKIFILDRPVPGRDCSPDCKYVIVNQLVYWDTARKYCLDRGWDLIQHNPKLSSLQGRLEIAATLNLPVPGDYLVYHTGIVRDEKDINVFKRVSTGVTVELEGWRFLNGNQFPDSHKWKKVVAWRTHKTALNKQKVFNTFKLHKLPFICEY